MKQHKRGRRTGAREAMGTEGPGFCSSFKHYRTGKVLYAKDYGLKAWPIGSSKKKR